MPPCESCPSSPSCHAAELERLGVRTAPGDYIVALAGNPNTGKSTLFNALTGLRQHTGNWPGKTISRAEGAFSYDGKRFKLVDLPGTYSLLSASPDEEVARDFILFGQPDVTVIVVDATHLERNLNLVLQILQITRKAVVCLNLTDEAAAHGIQVDTRGLARDLGVPVVPTAARHGKGIDALTAEVARVAEGRTNCRPAALKYNVPGLRKAIRLLSAELREVFPQAPHAEWLALRLLEGDPVIIEAVRTHELDHLQANGADEPAAPTPSAASEAATTRLLETADRLRWKVPDDIRDRWVETVYAEAARIAERNITRGGVSARITWERRLDRLLTNRWTGIPVMIGTLAIVLWITIAGANVPSQWLSSLFLEHWYPALKNLSAAAGVPHWLDGVALDGMFLTTAWVVSVMLPPMAIFFPLFTILEDFGYLPRVAFNLDHLFQRAGAHGKQALTMTMGWGCNAAGVIAARIIDSPRERLIAILTNNFALCNGRWPTQILIATIFIGALAPPAAAGIIAALAVLSVALLGVVLTFGSSWLLSHTVLRGEASTFSLELPPYRPPNILRTLYTSVIDRTIFVLWRAVIFALPAGALIWLVANVNLGGVSLAARLVDWLNPVGLLIGLNGVILLAFLIAIPANEIVIPTILMLTVLTTGVAGVGEAGRGVIFDTDLSHMLVLLQAGGWTLLTAVCVMLFSLCHNPCSTTIYTIWKETRSGKWTAFAAVFPVAVGFLLCGAVALVWRALV